MSERSKEHASKACEGEPLREFESRLIRSTPWVPPAGFLVIKPKTAWFQRFHGVSRQFFDVGLSMVLKGDFPVAKWYLGWYENRRNHWRIDNHACLMVVWWESVPLFRSLCASCVCHGMRG